MKKIGLYLLLAVICTNSFAQVQWLNIDSLYEPLPGSMHVFSSTDSVDGKPNRMYYAIADLEDKELIFTADTTMNRRLTPTGFYEKNDHPLLVVNTSFFLFDTHQNLNVVVSQGKLLSYNQHSIAGRKKDTLTYSHAFFSAIGIGPTGKADVAWILSDTALSYPLASQIPVPAFRDSLADPSWQYLQKKAAMKKRNLSKWNVQTAVGGGPVLVQDGKVFIANNEERKFAGKAIDDRHPRTAMGYTREGKLIVFVCEGRSEQAAGLSLKAMARILQQLGCVEALNLDGGGSSCMLINGKQTNVTSAKGIQRQVPSVFLIKRRSAE